MQPVLQNATTSHEQDKMLVQKATKQNRSSQQAHGARPKIKLSIYILNCRPLEPMKFALEDCPTVQSLFRRVDDNLLRTLRVRHRLNLLAVLLGDPADPCPSMVMFEKDDDAAYANMLKEVGKLVEGLGAKKEEVVIPTVCHAVSPDRMTDREWRRQSHGYNTVWHLRQL
ncbi:uncharacterized protein BKCO1_2000014 [Diplodia corticola]|uniref:Uncharacterized protein n=1 Tax=Diplodia corticola TaxID=236234 RepID=A0A1J9R0F0_9PEZI|nr:uncharacterized protein BKCO1_2000014 [Diplodia corticola]OJD34846.1 hypothetical protein BKCO1_2000014 [Diplodia corticola]